jgi:hypothetical protein
MRTKTRYREIKSDILPVEEIPAENIPEIKLNGVEAEPVAALSAEIPPQPEPEPAEAESEAVREYEKEAARADDAALALRKQLEQIRASEELQRQHTEHMALAQQQPLSREQKLDLWKSQGVPEVEIDCATVAQLNAIFGWTGSKMASLYTQNADRARLARDAIGKLVNETATSIPAPNQKVRASEQK